jgi:hypothetical protein
MKIVHSRQFVTLAMLAPCVAACQSTPPPDTARAPTAAFGSNGDTDVSAINIASWAFAGPANTRARPIEGAQAVAAVEYLAGELSSSPRWDFMSPLTKIQMLQARVEVRRVVGIAPQASSQQVLDALLAAASALQAHDEAAALKALTDPVFTRPAEQVLATLTNLPYLPEANIATQHALLQEQPSDLGAG